ncbi:hypothetical protein SNEBB_009911 [Seison nebaliae]|nr:hypothetical protein SNEBB_009911 [Seison nebaliae]
MYTALFQIFLLFNNFIELFGRPPPLPFSSPSSPISSPLSKSFNEQVVDYSDLNKDEFDIKQFIFINHDDVNPSGNPSLLTKRKPSFYSRVKSQFQKYLPTNLLYYQDENKKEDLMNETKTNDDDEKKFEKDNLNNNSSSRTTRSSTNTKRGRNQSSGTEQKREDDMDLTNLALFLGSIPFILCVVTYFLFKIISTCCCTGNPHLPSYLSKSSTVSFDMEANIISSFGTSSSLSSISRRRKICRKLMQYLPCKKWMRRHCFCSKREKMTRKNDITEKQLNGDDDNEFHEYLNENAKMNDEQEEIDSIIDIEPISSFPFSYDTSMVCDELNDFVLPLYHEKSSNYFNRLMNIYPTASRATNLSLFQFHQDILLKDYNDLSNLNVFSRFWYILLYWISLGCCLHCCTWAQLCKLCYFRIQHTMILQRHYPDVFLTKKEERRPTTSTTIQNSQTNSTELLENAEQHEKNLNDLHRSLDIDIPPSLQTFEDANNNVTLYCCWCCIPSKYNWTKWDGNESHRNRKHLMSNENEIIQNYMKDNPILSRLKSLKRNEKRIISSNGLVNGEKFVTNFVTKSNDETGGNDGIVKNEKELTFYNDSRFGSESLTQPLLPKKYPIHIPQTNILERTIRKCIMLGTNSIPLFYINVWKKSAIMALNESIVTKINNQSNANSLYSIFSVCSTNGSLANGDEFSSSSSTTEISLSDMTKNADDNIPELNQYLSIENDSSDYVIRKYLNDTYNYYMKLLVFYSLRDVNCSTMSSDDISQRPKSELEWKETSQSEIDIKQYMNYYNEWLEYLRELYHHSQQHQLNINLNPMEDTNDDKESRSFSFHETSSRKIMDDLMNDINNKNDEEKNNEENENKEEKHDGNYKKILEKHLQNTDISLNYTNLLSIREELMKNFNTIDYYHFVAAMPPKMKKLRDNKSQKMMNYDNRSRRKKEEHQLFSDTSFDHYISERLERMQDPTALNQEYFKTHENEVNVSFSGYETEQSHTPSILVPDGHLTDISKRNKLCGSKRRHQKHRQSNRSIKITGEKKEEYASHSVRTIPFPIDYQSCVSDQSTNMSNNTNNVINDERTFHLQTNYSHQNSVRSLRSNVNKHDNDDRTSLFN